MANRSVIHNKFMKSKAEDLPLSVAANLLANPEELDKMFKRWDERQGLYTTQELATNAAIEELRKLETDIGASQASLAEREEAVAKQEKSHASKHENDMGVWKRRSIEVTKRESTADERDNGLDGRSKEIERLAITRETELAEREAVIENREDAADVREADLVAMAKETEGGRNHLQTVSQMVKAAVEKL